MSAVAWQVVGASVRGASHVREDLENQDALLFDVPEGSGARAFAAVADGHGGARHFRSALGSRLAVAAAREVLSACATRFESLASAARVELAAVEVPQRIVARWVELARADLAARPITPDEWALLEQREGAEGLAHVRSDALLAYGATLLAALATPSCLVLCQLGDGDVLLVAPDGSTARPVARDERLVGNFTTSICRAGAEGDFRCLVLEGAAARPALVLLSTDGYANSFRTDADYLKVGGDFLDLVHGRGLDAVAQQLPGILEHASTHGSGDDITLALMAGDVHADGRRAAVPGTGSAEPGAAAMPDAMHAAQLHIARQRLVIAALSVALLAGLAWSQRERISRFTSREAPRKVVETLPPVAAPGDIKDGGLAPLVPAGAAGEAASQPALSSGHIEMARARHGDDGIEVQGQARIAQSSAEACVLHASVHGTDGHELASASKKFGKGELTKKDVRLLVPTSKDAAKAKAMRASAHPQFTLRVDCGRHTVATTGMLPVDE